MTQPNIDGDNSHLKSKDEESCVEEFATRFAKSSGVVYRCADTNKIVPTIEEIIAARSRGKNCYSKEVLTLISEVKTGGRRMDEIVHSAFQYDPLEGEDGLDVLSQIDTGITTSDYGIAETGSLVEISYSDSTKLLSSLSRVNIVLVRRGNILQRLEELAPILRKKLSRDAVDKPTVTLIGGPSRTGDIEMKMVFGVHGPHEVHAIIIP